jgi:hypothetical protein
MCNYPGDRGCIPPPPPPHFLFFIFRKIKQTWFIAHKTTGITSACNNMLEFCVMDPERGLLRYITYCGLEMHDKNCKVYARMNTSITMYLILYRTWKKPVNDGTSSQAKCPILAYFNLPLGRIPTHSETSNRRALSFACTNQIAPCRYVHFKYCWPQWQAFLVACVMVFCLEKKRERFLAQQSVFIDNYYK